MRIGDCRAMWFAIAIAMELKHEPIALRSAVAGLAFRIGRLEQHQLWLFW